jgi:acyl-CoA reductase-like NAD-dependent aldehyde dehydrogenase
MFPMAIVCGNTSILKPSERDPGCSMILMELLKQAGCPPGVVNVIHGRHDCMLKLLFDWIAFFVYIFGTHAMYLMNRLTL